MGPKTIKRLAVVAVVLVLAIVSVFLIQRSQMARLGKSNFAEAEQAVERGDLATAEQLYLQHVQVFPDDVEGQLKYADVLLKVSKTPARTRPGGADLQSKFSTGSLDGWTSDVCWPRCRPPRGGVEAARQGRDNLADPLERQARGRRA